ncbi:MAG: transporter [Woeseiaceae bacterium]
MIRVSTLVTLLVLVGQVSAQDLEPRRWTPVPAGVNVVGAGYVALQGDVYLDPVLEVQDAEVSGHVVGVSYVRSFAIGNKLARFDATVPWQNMRWTGQLNGEPASAERVGLADPVVRLSIILAGASADKKPGKDGKSSSTVFGAAVAVSVPVGEYQNDKLINLGFNRAYVRPQLGVLHTRGQWSFELTGSTFIFEDNDDFFGGSRLEQEPLYAVQGHIIKVFDKPGYWAALSAGYGWKGESIVDDMRADDSRKILLWSLAFGMPTGSNHGLKFAYINNRTKTDKGADIDSLAIAWSYRF